MTNEQAIAELQKEHDLIQSEHDLYGSQFAPALLEALAMAIETLKAQDMTLYMNLPEVSAEEAVEILKRNNRIELIPSGEDTNVPNTDTISRQATITEIKNYERDSTAPIDYVKIVEQMPPAQPDARYINTNELIKRLQQAGLDGAVSIAVKMAGHERLKQVPSAQPELIRCKDCKYSEHWYKDKTRCFLWHETWIDVFEDGYCNYAKRHTDADMRGEQDE